MTKNVREAEIERYLTNSIEKRGGLCLKFKSTFRGVPDRVVILHGKVYFVETKRPKGGVISPLQKYWIEKIKDCGVLALILDNKEDIDEFVEAIYQGWDAYEPYDV